MAQAVVVRAVSSASHGVAKGRREGIRLYEFLKEPLTERFGKDWYDELALACSEYLKSQDIEK